MSWTYHVHSENGFMVGDYLSKIFYTITYNDNGVEYQFNDVLQELTSIYMFFLSLFVATGKILKNANIHTYLINIISPKLGLIS